jgi:[acyl-carrier-protein] S-malonyltransferase
MKAYVFPGQGAQFSGMGKDLYENSPLAKEMFLQANEILGFNITDVMFEGSDEELKQTKVTQPAIFLHSTILAACLGDSFQPDMVAGHSLGEFSALVANKTLRFEDGLKLVYQRALAMHVRRNRQRWQQFLVWRITLLKKFVHRLKVLLFQQITIVLDSW